MAKKVAFQWDDGNWFEMDAPDSVPMDQLLSQVEKEWGGGRKISNVEIDESLGSKLKEGVKDVARGFLKSTAGTAADAAFHPMRGLVTSSPKVAEVAASESAAMADRIDKTIPTPTIEDKSRQYLRGGLEGLGGSLTPGGGWRGPLAGFGGGLGAEVGKTQLGPVGAFAGGLLGGGITGLGSMAFTNTRQLAQEALSTVSPQDLAFGKGMQKEAQALGTQLLPNQALPSANRLDDVADYLAQTHLGTGTQKLLQAQPGWVANRGKVEVGTLPGQQVVPQQAADEVSRAATTLLTETKGQSGANFRRTLKTGVEGQQAEAQQLLERALAAKKGRDFASTTADAWNQEDLDKLTNLMFDNSKKGLPIEMGVKPPNPITLPDKQPLVNAAMEATLTAGKIPPKALSGFDAALGDLMAKNHPDTDTYRLAADMRDALRKVPVEQLADPSYLKSAFDANIGGQGPLSLAAGVDKARASRASAQVRNAWREHILGDQTPRSGGLPLKNATDVYAAHRAEVYEPMKASVTGRVAGKNGLPQDAESGAVSKLKTIFQKGGERNGSSEIRTLATDLAKVEGGSEAFLNAAKTHVADTFDNALSTSSIRVPQEAAAKVYNAFYGTDQKSGATRELLTQMATLSGRDPKAVEAGFRRFARMAGAMAERPARITSLPAAEAGRIAGQSAVGRGLQAIGSPFYRVGQAVQNRVNQGTMREMDRIFSSPDALEQLEALSRLPMMSRRAQGIMGTLLGTNASQQGSDPSLE